jgi:hypothetical protein
MATLPIIILHGWSDTSDSFRNKNYARSSWLRDQGLNIVDIELGDYLSMNDEVSLFDIGYAFQKALTAAGIAQTRHSFDLVVHSTGSLVAREYLRQICVNDATATPVRHLCMLAPANFGSPLAKMGKSVVGRFLKGWDWNHVGESGKLVLDGLELASPYSFQLALDDLFRVDFPLFDPTNVMLTVMVGTCPYDDPLKSIIHENGSDGTVRPATANLNAHYFKVEFGDPHAAPILTTGRLGYPGKLAFAVFHRNHGSIIDPDVPTQQAEWVRTFTDALNLDPTAYAAHVQRCDAITAQTFADGAQSAHREWYHQYMHVAIRVQDQFGAPVPDYVIEFYQPVGDRDNERVTRRIHKDIIEKVTKNEVDPSYRSFFFDTNDLLQLLSEGHTVDMSLTAARISPRIGYSNPEGGVRVFSDSHSPFLHINEPVLVDITLRRDPNVSANTPDAHRVFRLTKP